MLDEKQTPSAGLEPENKPADKVNEPTSADGDNTGVEEELVQISKKELDDLQGLKGRQSELTKREQRIAKKEKALKSRTPKKSESSNRFSFEEPEEEEIPQGNEAMIEDQQEFVKLKSSLVDKIFDNDDYQKVLRKDKTLARIIKKDPLALLDSMPIDAEDALDSITELLDELVSELPEEPGKHKEEKKAPKPAPQSAKKTEPAQKKSVGFKSAQEIESGLLGRVNKASGY